MTVAESGSKDGLLRDVISESQLETDDPRIVLSDNYGRINADLTVGVDVTRSGELQANTGISHDGVKLHGSGFIVTPLQAEHLGLGHTIGLEAVIKPYRNGRDLAAQSRNLMVVDLFGYSAEQARHDFPAVYQHILANVKPERERNNRATYRENWWIFGEPRRELRPALATLKHYIATVDTARHRIFQFIPSNFVLDDKSVLIANDDAALLAVLSSRLHVCWAVRTGGWLGQGNDAVYTKTRTFDPFPFPESSEELRQKLRAVGEELDVTRKKVLAEHPDLTLTGLYNVLEKLKTGTALDPKDEDVKDRGLVLILKELHETIDRLTAEAYGWPTDLTDEQILEKLVALNAERAKEEAAGHVRWLRPDYQIPRFAKGAAAKTGEMDFGETVVAIDKAKPQFPKDRYEQPLAVEAMLLANGQAMDAAEIARGFKNGGKKIEQRVIQVLTTLARYGRVTAIADGKFVARKAA